MSGGMKPSKLMAFEKEDFSKYSDRELKACIMAWEIIDPMILIGVLAETKRREYLNIKEPPK